ncbi:MAG: type IV pilus twitching motility protein PilT [Patescibacteria group bacterium]|jgi:twitching motility protein PilT|nr:type IV pilus twitching motility protein PilT [Patescibacteria group bacterium]
MTLKSLFKIAIEKKASDLHLVVGRPPFLRIDGELEDIEGVEVINKKDIEAMIFDVLKPEEKNKFLDYKELDFGMSMDDYRFRINLHYERGNMGLVARVITDEMSTLEDIDMPQIVYNLLDLKHGLILMTGPTGCGKSTTLAAMVDYINKTRRANIITFEDPIEYLFKSDKSVIIQRQLGSDMMSFNNGLKHALRQDPDVIMVGEMRDLETIATTITLAETGHLVLATLHTYNAAQTIDRIIDIFPSHQQSQVRMQIANTLAGVISQRLLHKKDGGRIAAREVMINNPAVSNLIRENKIAQLKTVIETNSKDGMVSIDQDIKRLYKEGLVDKHEAQSYMDNPEILEKLK